MTYDLAITDRTYSSWSLRAWLLFAKLDIPVTLTFVRSFDPGFLDGLAAFAPARTVPALRIEGGRTPVLVWDSLAIAETLAERFPDRAFWPADLVARGLARSIAAEMHSGFGALRDACPMNLGRAYAGFRPTDEVMADLARIETLWTTARARAGAGPWLFGAWSAADAFFAPVAARIATYDLPAGPEAAAYVAIQLADPAFRAWRAAGLADGTLHARYEFELPARPWPGPAALPARAVATGLAANATCPFSGEPVAADSLADIDGIVIGFCNPFCRDKVVADPEAWPAAMAALAAARG